MPRPLVPSDGEHVRVPLLCPRCRPQPPYPFRRGSLATDPRRSPSCRAFVTRKSGGVSPSPKSSICSGSSPARPPGTRCVAPVRCIARPHRRAEASLQIGDYIFTDASNADHRGINWICTPRRPVFASWIADETTSRNRTTRPLGNREVVSSAFQRAVHESPGQRPGSRDGTEDQPPQP
jgi:hypothetical protein